MPKNISIMVENISHYLTLSDPLSYLLEGKNIYKLKPLQQKSL